MIAFSPKEECSSNPCFLLVPFSSPPPPPPFFFPFFFFFFWGTENFVCVEGGVGSKLFLFYQQTAHGFVLGMPQYFAPEDVILVRGK